MKKIYTLFIIFISLNSVLSQTASDYYPSSPGHKWYYKTVPLDSLNNEITDFTLYRIDSFAIAADYLGRNANFVLTKTATFNTVSFIPYIDTEYVSLEGQTGYEYLTFGGIDLAFLDSIGVNFDIAEALKGWYSVYRFDRNLNDPYQIFSKDTSVSINEEIYPVRLSYIGERFADESLVTDAGTFQTKKFNISFQLGYLLTLIPNFPPIEVPLLEIKDTVWIAENNWIVKSFIPSSNVDLTLLDLGSFYIPGSNREAIPPITLTDLNEKSELPGSFALNQNYPNPFNPETKIKFAVPSTGKVKLKVLNILGKEIAILIDKNLDKGEHSFIFNSAEYNLSSGVYFYRLEFDYKALTKKMILMK